MITNSYLNFGRFKVALQMVLKVH